MKFILLFSFIFISIQFDCIWKGGYSYQTFNLASNWDNCNGGFPQQNDNAFIQGRIIEFFTNEVANVQSIQLDASSIVTLSSSFTLKTENLVNNGKVYNYGIISIAPQVSNSTTTFISSITSSIIIDGKLNASGLKALSLGTIFNNDATIFILDKNFNQTEINIQEFNSENIFSIQAFGDIFVNINQMKPLEDSSSFSLISLNGASKLTTNNITGNSIIRLIGSNGAILNVQSLDLIGSITSKQIICQGYFNVVGKVITNFLDLKSGVRIPFNYTLTSNNITFSSLISFKFDNNCGLKPLFESQTFGITFKDVIIQLENDCAFDGDITLIKALTISGNVKLMDTSTWKLVQNDFSLFISKIKSNEQSNNLWILYVLIGLSLCISIFIFIGFLSLGVLIFYIKRNQNRQINNVSEEYETLFE